MGLQGKCQVRLLICAFCIVFFFEMAEGTQAKKEHRGLLGSQGKTGQQVHTQRGLGQLEKRRGRGGDDEQEIKEEEVDPYSNIEMFLRKGTLKQNNSFVGDDDKKDKIKNGIGYTTEPDFDLSLGSWFENLLYSDYEDKFQDISTHEHDETHSGDNNGGQELGHKHHSHSLSERGQEERHSDEDHSDEKKQNPTSSASVSMATWLVSFSSITVISLVRSF